MSWSPPSSAEIAQILRDAKTVAIVGISDKPERASHAVAKYLQNHSHFDLYFVNPALDEVLGQKVYSNLSEISAEIDIVDVFRKAEDCPSVLDAAIAIGAKAIWFQLGIFVPELATRANESGMSCVMDRCIKVDYEALF